MSQVTLWMTSCASDRKTKKDIYRLKQLLDTKRVPYSEVRML